MCVCLLKKASDVSVTNFSFSLNWKNSPLINVNFQRLGIFHQFRWLKLVILTTVEEMSNNLEKSFCYDVATCILSFEFLIIMIEFSMYKKNSSGLILKLFLMFLSYLASKISNTRLAALFDFKYRTYSNFIKIIWKLKYQRRLQTT